MWITIWMIIGCFFLILRASMRSMVRRRVNLRRAADLGRESLLSILNISSKIDFNTMSAECELGILIAASAIARGQRTKAAISIALDATDPVVTKEMLSLYADCLDKSTSDLRATRAVME